MSTQVRVTKERVSEGPSSSVRTTSYETKSSYEGGDFSNYRPGVTARNTIIHRTSYEPRGVKSSQQMSRSFSGAGSGIGMSGNAFATVANTGMKQVTDTRHNEKRDMQDLNERFASYIEKVRFLEAQNRKLADELDKLKAKWGKETTAIKAMYQAELDEARRLLDEAEKEKARFQIRADSIEEHMNELKDNELRDVQDCYQQQKDLNDGQIRTISDMEAEVSMLRKRIDSLENEKEKDKKEIARLTDALNRARIDLDNETLNHIDAENRRQTLEEEIEFLKQVHEQEMKELAALAYRDTTKENREFWKNEMGGALRDIQVAYDTKLDEMRGELETYYNLKIQEFRTGATRQNMETTHAKEEAKRLRTQLTDLRSKLADLEARNAMLEKELECCRRDFAEKERDYERECGDLTSECAKLKAEMEAILKELQDLMDTKLGLELEIAAYRKLLEGEENRSGLKGMVDSWVTSSSSGSRMESDATRRSVKQEVQQQQGSSDSGQVTMKLKFEKNAKGSVSIDECAPNGLYVMLANNGRQVESLSGWHIKRVIDGQERCDLTMDADFKIEPGQKIKLYARGAKPSNASRNDKEVDLQTFGLGGNITTRLVNPNNEDRATHVQKTIYTS